MVTKTRLKFYSRPRSFCTCCTPHCPPFISACTLIYNWNRPNEITTFVITSNYTFPQSITGGRSRSVKNKHKPTNSNYGCTAHTFPWKSLKYCLGTSKRLGRDRAALSPVMIAAAFPLWAITGEKSVKSSWCDPR